MFIVFLNQPPLYISIEEAHHLNNLHFNDLSDYAKKTNWHDRFCRIGIIRFFQPGGCAFQNVRHSAF